MRRLPTGTVTFLFTDIEGSTRLLGELGGEQYAEALREHRRLLREVFAAHGGVEVDTQGDAFFYAFPQASEAVAAADRAQRALAAGRVAVRIGIHTGEPVLTDEGYVGTDVHRAARICGAAHGGQVLLSEQTRAGLNRELELVDLGLHRLKDLGEPEKLFQLGAGDFPPLRSLNATNLPAQVSELIGRTREVAELQALVRARRLVTLTGAGGSGKTRLALQVAAELTDEFKDGVFWVALSGLSDAAAVEPTIAQTVGAKNGLADHLARRRALLLLDNFEQVLAAAPSLSALLERCPNLHLLVTSRAVLRLIGEREYEVEPLPERDAVALFRERAVAAEPSEAVAEICRRLDCLPLAIELAAARTRLLAPDELLQRLEQRIPLLATGRRDAPERHRTLRAAIAWSYELLAEAERKQFARLGVFAGGWTSADGEAVCGASLDSLQSLAEQSLVRRERGRFVMLATVREFALERLDALGEIDAVLARLVDRLCERAARTDPRTRQYYDDQDNWRAAVGWALERGDAERVAQLVCAAGAWQVPLAERHQWTLRALRERNDLSPLASARLLGDAAFVQYLMGNASEAILEGERALALFREHGTDRDVAEVLVDLGQAVSASGDLERAERLLSEAVAVATRLDDETALFTAVHTLGEIARDRGELAKARPLLERALALARKHGRRPTYILHGLGDLALEQGDLASAQAAYAESLALSRSIFAPYTLAHCLGGFAAIAAERGRVRDAGEIWGALESYQEEQSVRLGPRESARYLGRLERLDHAAFAAAVEDGRTLSVDEAAERALALVD